MAKLLSHPGIAYEINSEGYRLYKGIHTPLAEDEIIACPYCKGKSVCGFDGIDCCDDCDMFVEGETIILSEKESVELWAK